MDNSAPSDDTKEELIAPYPDRDINTTFWMSLGLGLIGLDHFYLRSPKTGTLKLLTFGGLGIWWLWDVLQLLFEKERVTQRGLTAPFELVTGIGKGQITMFPSHIKQRTDYFNWFLSAFLDIFGITALTEGRPAAFLRRLIDGVLLLTFIGVGIGNPERISYFGILMAFIFAFFTIVPSFFTIRAIFNPIELGKKGVHIPANLVKLFNFFESWTDIIGPNATAVVRHDFGLATVDPTTAPHEFGYANEEEIEAEKEAAAAAVKTNKKELISWPISFGIGNLFGGLVLSIVNLFSFIPTVKMGLLAADSYFAAVRLSRGETPDIPDIGGFLPPGLGNLASAKGIGSLVEKIPGVGDLAGKVTEAAATIGKAENLVSKATTALRPEQLIGQATQKLGSIEQSVKNAAVKTIQQTGGARDNTLSTESLVLGATVLALIAGGAIKLTVDSLVRN